MPTFDMVVVGSGGGPDETNISAYLIKSCDAAWEDGIVALEAGSGNGALNQILRRNPNLFAPHPNTSVSTRRFSSNEIYSFVQCYLITHAHLDHINSLIISAGSLAGPRKRIFATQQTLHDLETIFNDRIWPNLASWNEDDESYKFLYTALHTDDLYKVISPSISVLTMPLSHGHYDTSGTYQSSAFFIRHDPTGREFLFFGDVEPDSVASKPQTINVWRVAATKIADNKTLHTIFIECSWAEGRRDDVLYGHLSPKHLVVELTTLASEVVGARQRISVSLNRSPREPKRKKHKSGHSPNREDAEALRGALDGLRIYVMHCKDSPDGAHDRPVSGIIVDQVKALVEAQGLGAEIIATAQGMRIEI